MPVYFYQGKPLIRGGKVAVDEACCCEQPLCDCPCCPDEDFGGFRITIVAAEPAGGFAEPCCEDVGGVYDALITEENPTACEGRTFVTLGCGTLEVSWNIGCGGEFKTLSVGVILRSDLGEAEAQVNNQVALDDPCVDLGFTGLQDTLVFPGVGDCAELTISAEALPCGSNGQRRIRASVTSVSETEGTVSAFANFEGSASGRSHLMGRLASDADVIGGVTGASFAEGTLSALGNGEGSVSGTSSTSATITALSNAEGDISGTSTLTGSLVGFGTLSGEVDGTSTVTSDLTALANLSGGVSGVSKTTGRLAGDAEISGGVGGASVISGTLSAFGNTGGEVTGVSDTETTLSAYANLAGEVTGVSVLTGNVESCCCGDCIRFRYTISGLANDSCTTCNDYNTDNDSDNVNPNESCVYSAQWESSDCNGTQLVFNAELICDDDGDIRLTGSVRDAAILEPLIDPPVEGPEPTNDIMSGTDTFTLGTPCDELEITLSRDTGAQTTCDFDNATVVLKVIDCPENQAVMRKLRNKRARTNRARKVGQKTAELPICQHRGEELGKADCQCAGKPMVWHCTLLDQPCIAQTVGKPITKAGDKRISSPVACSLCEHFEATGNPRSEP